MVDDIKKTSHTGGLGWSISRYDKFLNCKRQYFYDYYAKFDNDVSFEKIQFLKSLTSKALEVGNIVHDVIRDMLKRYQISTKPLNKSKFFKYSFDVTKKYCNSKTFFEHYYYKEVVSAYDVYEKIEMILKKFLDSARFEWIEKNAIYQSSKWIIEPKNFGETWINGCKFFCKVDFLFPIGDKICIIDWKTGKPDEEKHSRQLTGYSLWANCHFNKEAYDIIPMIVYLHPQYREKNVKIENDAITEFTNTVLNETENMCRYLVDIEKNIPKVKLEFPLTNNVFFCKYCNYKEICAKN
ncbi:MAG: PD-(D/E)XK nuclease family protein [Endomicrobium sp.]|nr:PD-(D/E)XK nuclease family protein [Endomicrobium sp.]